MRRRDDSDRNGRKFNSSQMGDSRNRNGVANSVSDSVSSANTRHHNKRPSNYISKLPEVSSSAFALSDSSPTDIPRIGFTRRTTIAEFTPREGEMRSTVTSASRQNVTEAGARVNEPRSRGQFRNRSRELAGTERSTETRQQRTNRRTSVRLDGSSNKLSADAMTNSKPQTSARNLGGETLSRSSDVTQNPLKGRGGSRWNHSRGQGLEISKVTKVLVVVLMKCKPFKTETNPATMKLKSFESCSYLHNLFAEDLFYCDPSQTLSLQEQVCVWIASTILTTTTYTCHSPDVNTYNFITLWYSHYMDHLCTSIYCRLMIPTILRTKILFCLIIHLCFIYACLM